jgi:hypothetical protein
VKSLRDASELFETLVRDLFHAPKYAERRGAAYGLAGAIKGRGISPLKQFDIIGRLKDAMEDKKKTQARQGALFALETLTSGLGLIFEPFVIQMLPYLLSALGDTSTEVREAAQDASRVIMSRISGHGVKQILPLLLAGLDDRRKLSSVLFICSTADDSLLHQNGDPKRVLSSSWGPWLISRHASSRSRYLPSSHASPMSSRIRTLRLDRRPTPV